MQLHNYLRGLRIPETSLAQRPAPLPANWNQDEDATRQIGSQWRQLGSSCLLAVPSAILPEEDNFVLNPEHLDAQRLRLVRERSFSFDSRLI